MKQFTFTDPSTGFTATVTVTENGDGTLSFVMDVDESTGTTGDVRAMYLNTTNDADYNLSITSDDGSDAPVTALRDEANAIRWVDSKDTNINGEVIQENDGAFDAGFEFGTQGLGSDDVQHMEFTISSDDGAYLTLDSFDWTTLGLRVTSVGDVDGSRNGSLKLTGEEDDNPQPPEQESTVIAEDDIGFVFHSDLGTPYAIAQTIGTLGLLKIQDNDDDPDTLGIDSLGDTIFLKSVTGADGTTVTTDSDDDGFFDAVMGSNGGMIEVNATTGEVRVSDPNFEFDPFAITTTSVTYEIEDATGATDTALISIDIVGFDEPMD